MENWLAQGIAFDEIERYISIDLFHIRCLYDKQDPVFIKPLYDVKPFNLVRCDESHFNGSEAERIYFKNTNWRVDFNENSDLCLPHELMDLKLEGTH